MSTITGGSLSVVLPQSGRGETVFGAVAVLVGILALIVKLTAVFG